MTREEISRRIKEINAEIRKLKEQLAEARRTLQKLEELIRRLETQVTRINEHLDNQMNSLQRKAAGIDIQSRLKEDFLSQAKQIIRGPRANASIEKLRNARQKCISKISETEGRIRSLSTRIRTLEQEKNKLLRQLAETEA